MQDYTLGLDLGPNSIGWALVDEDEQRIAAAGVRVFPEGVDRDTQGGEQSKNVTRRTARGTRRLLARRARRKRRLRQLLTQAGLLPTDTTELGQLLTTNPYELRRRALDESLTPHEFGRTILHLNQRRGFLSNRKTDKPQDSETKGMLKEISELAGAIESAGCRTLGEYLAKMGDGFEHASADQSQRIRNRHTRRDMYGYEFEAIWTAQHKHHPQRLTDELKQQIHSIIFFQRSVYWPKSVVGRCELEPKHKRCLKSHRAAQRFRLLQEVNNLRVIDTHQERRLTPEERSVLLDYLATAKERTFDQIRKKLGLLESVIFNYEKASRNKLKGHETDARLAHKKVFGKAWFAMPDDQKNAIVHILMDEESEDEALRRLTNECSLSAEQAQRALSVNFPDGRMSYSLEAITKLLPHLEQGLLLMGNDASDSALHAAGYLRPDERVVNERDFLPPSPDLTNPIVRQALVEVHKVVNSIIREYGKPAKIHVELAREAKSSAEQREEILIQNARRRRQREEIARRIEEYGDFPTRAKIQKYLLWEEQGGDCIYSGQPISLAQLLSAETQVDHILPRWRSLDDSMANKVVCFRGENANKGDRTPYEWLAESDPDKYEQILLRAKKLPYNKQRKFIQRDVILDDFIARQLTDTAYISRCVKQYLRCLGPDPVCPHGHMTAELRHRWGLNAILDPQRRNKKNRSDHRHHAIDAIVIALTDKSSLKKLAEASGHNVPLPWDGLRADVESVVERITVSHRVRRRIAGALHEETIYGATQRHNHPSSTASSKRRGWAKDWVEDCDTYVRRKPVDGLTNTKQLQKVRDETIQKILMQHLRDHGIDPESSAKIPNDAFKGEKTPRMKSGMPIRRVRMIEESKTFRKVSDRRSCHFVKPGNNHHIVYRSTGDGERQKWVAEVVTMWDAAVRARNGTPVVDRSDRDGQNFVLSLSIGESFEIDGDNNQRQLCVVRKLDQRSLRVFYAFHTDARTAGEINQDNLSISPDNMRKRNARKVTIDPLGRIRWAHD